MYDEETKIRQVTFTPWMFFLTILRWNRESVKLTKRFNLFSLLLQNTLYRIRLHGSSKPLNPSRKKRKKKPLCHDLCLHDLTSIDWAHLKSKIQSQMSIIVAKICPPYPSNSMRKDSRFCEGLPHGDPECTYYGPPPHCGQPVMHEAACPIHDK